MRPLLWIPMLALKATVVLLGLVAVPLMLATRNKPAWLWRPWYNPRTGLDVPSWFTRSRFWWNAIRNPANGLRSYPWITVKIDQEKVRSKSNGLPTNPYPLRKKNRRVGWFYAWHGVYSGLWVCVLWNRTHHMKLRFGWKILPDDATEVEAWRRDGAGFAMAFIPYRKG